MKMPALPTDYKINIIFFYEYWKPRKFWTKNPRTSTKRIGRIFIKLSNFSDDDITKVISEFIGHKPNQQLINQVTNIDPKKRPLFVLLVAAAFQDNPKANFASIEEIVDDLIKREKANWRAANMTESQINLYALATMTGELNSKQINQLNNDLFGKQEQRKINFISATTTGKANNKLVTMQPDILGEYFVLSRLAYLEQQYDESKKTSLRDIAWIEAAFAMGIFVQRCQQDFSNHKNSKFLH